MWHLGIWLRGDHGAARLTVELDNLEGLFQPPWFFDYVIISLSFLKSKAVM